MLSSARNAATGLAVLACLAATACDPPVVGPTVLALGSADPGNPTAFTPLSDGATVSLTAGNQGGQHIWLDVHASGIAPGRPEVSIQLYRASDDTMIGANNYGGDGWARIDPLPTYTSVPLAAQIYSYRYCEVLQGARVRIHVHVDDRAGHTQDADVTVAVQGWTGDSIPEFVQQREACCASYRNTMCWPDGPPADAGADVVVDAQDAADDASRDGGDISDVTLDAAMDAGDDARDLDAAVD